MPYIQAEPYPYPQTGDLSAANTALIIIDMQSDFCSSGGYLAQKGYDISLTQAPIPRV
jgi:biuret amidohydrolase